jgi:phenylpyruvate tautomerase PptA (4-oxalocrotonate tautomerase family)
MPILDVFVVVPEGNRRPAANAKTLANAVAAVFGADPGTVWVRVQALPQSMYAENGDDEDPSPVFIKVQHADMKAPEHLEREARELAQIVAACLGCQTELVHIEYAPAARGRIAFGGRLLR